MPTAVKTVGGRRLSSVYLHCRGKVLFPHTSARARVNGNVKCQSVQCFSLENKPLAPDTTERPPQAAESLLGTKLFAHRHTSYKLEIKLSHSKYMDTGPTSPSPGP